MISTTTDAYRIGGRSRLAAGIVSVRLSLTVITAQRTTAGP
jgi:hypothetical protein